MPGGQQGSGDREGTVCPLPPRSGVSTGSSAKTRGHDMYLPCIWTDGLCLPFLIPQGVRPETDVKGEKTGAPGAPVRLLPDGG